MKAVDFIKKFGWNEAKRIIGMSRKHGKFRLHYSLSNELYYGQINDIRVSVDDLKQLVDAWELIEAYGGLDQANNTIAGLNWVRQDALRKAIELVESVNGNN